MTYPCGQIFVLSCMVGTMLMAAGLTVSAQQKYSHAIDWIEEGQENAYCSIVCSGCGGGEQPARAALCVSGCLARCRDGIRWMRETRGQADWPENPGPTCGCLSAQCGE